MPPPPLVNNIPCCLIMDSSALLSTQPDMVELLRSELPKSPHILVIPEDVLAELIGLQRATAGNTASQAESILRVLSKYPDFAARIGSGAGGAAAGSSTASPPSAGSGTRQRGIAVLQRPKETFYPLEKFARNRDTKIVACAYYFAVSDNNSSFEGETQQTAGPVRRFNYENAFFVTNDVVQQIKASPYGIPTIDTATLKMRWGHLGHWEP